MTREGYSYDPLKNTLTLSAAFNKRASVLNSREYQIILKYRADNPGMRIVPEGRTGKPSSKSITFKQMEAYIALFDDESKSIRGQFEKVKSMSKIQSSPYCYVRKWFESQFPHYREQVSFDAEGKITFAGAENGEKETVEEASADAA